jgi:ABC-type multidrug transport system ATPase subunit
MEEAEHLANRIVVINKGKLIADGTADQLKKQTGGSTLEVRVADRRDVGRAAALLAEAGMAEPRTDPEQGLVSIPAATGVDLLLEAGRRLKEAKIAVDDLGTRRPTLDEVFLALTGGETPSHPGSPDDPGPSGDAKPLSHAASEPEATR